MNATTYAVDIAKSVFHVHWVEPETGEIHNRKLSRAKFSAFIAQRQPGRIVMEACGSAHYWGVPSWRWATVSSSCPPSRCTSA